MTFWVLVIFACTSMSVDDCTPKNRQELYETHASCIAAAEAAGHALEEKGGLGFVACGAVTIPSQNRT